LAASAQIGALIATQDSSRAALYGEYGRLIGLAFQIQDDIMGIWGNAAITGKAASDIYQRKKTLPLLYGLEQADEVDRRNLLDLLRTPNMTEAEVTKVVIILDRLGARQFTAARAADHYRDAARLLSEAQLEGRLTGYLHAIADFLVNRQS
jgi:geranylgeranyl diphosphate synthase type I